MFGAQMYGAAPYAAMQAWPPHLMPGGMAMDVGGGMHGGAPDAGVVLKLKGLPFSASAQDVGVFFDGFALVNCSIHHGADGRPSGMAYAVFSTPDEAQRAMSKDRAYIGERFIKIMRCANSEMDDQMGVRHMHGYGAYGGYPSPEAFLAMNAAYAYGYMPHGMYPPHGMAGGFPGFVPPRMPNPGQQGRAPNVAAPQQRGPAGSTVKMRGLPFRVSPAEVLTFFEGFNALPESLHMGSDAHGRPSGEGWLSFGSEEEAARACSTRNRQYLGSRYLELTIV